MKKRNIRERITDLLEKKHYLTVPDMMTLLEEEGRSCNKTSIYRNLDKMLAENVVCRHSFGTDKVYYELRHSHSDHHDHFVCEHCKKIDLLDCVIDSNKVPAGYVIEHHHATLFGICSACKHHAT